MKSFWTVTYNKKLSYFRVFILFIKKIINFLNSFYILSILIKWSYYWLIKNCENCLRILLDFFVLLNYCNFLLIFSVRDFIISLLFSISEQVKFSFIFLNVCSRLIGLKMNLSELLIKLIVKIKVFFYDVWWPIKKRW